MSLPYPALDPAIETVVRRSLDRIRHDYPDTRAILLKGSLVRGDAGPYSDIDLDVLVDALDDAEYIAWFDEEAGWLHHVSIAVHAWDTWWEDASAPVEWALGLAACEVFHLLWTRNADDATHFTDAGIVHPAADPELEDCFSDLGKVRNALLRGDELGVRTAAHGVGRLCPTVLAVINPGFPAEPVTSPRAALDAILTFPVAPAGYREDLLCCIGLSSEATRMEDVASAAERLVRETIALLEEHAAWSDDEANPRYEIGLDTALANRTLRAYVHQIHLSTGN